MTPPPFVYVLGQARCGATLLMTMLAAGGYPLIGRPPDFELLVEPLDLLEDPCLQEIWNDCMDRGGPPAVKWLNPEQGLLGQMPPDSTVLRLRRDLPEQAKSQTKFLRLMGALDLDALTRVERVQYLKGIELQLARTEQRVTVELALRPDVRVLDLRFEALLRDAATCAESVAAVLGGLDVLAMSQCVIPRPPACRPDLRIEELLAERTAAMGTPDLAHETHHAPTPRSS